MPAMSSHLKNHSPDSVSDKYNVEFSSRHDFDGLATTEMTGLIYRAPISADELDSYKSLYPFSPKQYCDD